MRLRSTGLGRTEVLGELLEIRRVQDVLIFFVNTTEPVKWRTRMAFQEKDLRTLVWSLFKLRNLCFIFRYLCSLAVGVLRSPQSAKR